MICQVKPGSRPESMPFRLVDVTLDRVAPAPSLCDYVALSYVWGNISPYTLRQSEVRYDPPHDRNFDKSYTILDRDALPRTIRDAMFAVACLGERYLWVDSLCIVQDDVDDLNQNLRQLHRIYSGATLTIVAAYGDNADAGLSGLYAEIRDISSLTITIDTVNLMQAETEMPHQGTAWHKRGWTYQEYRFSKRCLMFADERVYFECPSGQRGEAMPDYLSPLLQVDRSAVPSPYSKVSYRTEYMSVTNGHRLHVSSYTSRDLTYECDVLNAFAAIITEYEERHGGKFCWGLPRNKFASNLCWKGEEQLRRRQVHPNGTCFPSWSWAGWVGQVTYDTFHMVSSAITWPWEDAYDISSTSDFTNSGILSIKAEIASVRVRTNNFYVTRHGMWFYDACDRSSRVDLQPDEGLQRDKLEQHRYMLLGEVDRARIFALILEQHENGVFYRIGIFVMQWVEWEACKPVEQVIRLG